MSGSSRSRTVLASAVALLLGLGVMAIDTRPGWDDTGISVGLLLIAAAIGAFLGAPAWVAAPLAALPLIVAELPGGAAILLTIPIAFAGALVGRLARRAMRGR